MLRSISSFVLFFVISILTSNAEDIEIINNQRVENFAILSNLTFNGDGVPSDDEINSSLQKLNDTGLFSKVNITTSGSKVVIDVSENPIVFSFKVTDERGKNIFKDDNSKKNTNSTKSNIIILKKGSVFSQSKLNEVLSNLRKKYRDEFKWNVLLIPNVYYLQDNLVKVEILVKNSLSFNISKIKKINFIGNKKIKDKKLKRSLAFLTESSNYDILNIFGRYNNELVFAEIENLKRVYRSEGYINISIDYVSDYIEQQNKFIVNFIINEGIKFKFGKINIVSSNANLLDELAYDFNFLSGRIYNVNHLDKVVSLIESWLSKNNYSFQVDLNKNINNDLRTIDVVLSIIPKGKLAIENVNLINPNEINNYVISKNLGYYEGDIFDPSNVSNAALASLRNSWISQSEARTFQSIKSSENFEDKVDIVSKFTIPSVTSPRLTISTEFGHSNFLDTGLFIGSSLKNIFGGTSDIDIGATISRNGITGKFNFEDRFTLSGTVLRVSFFDEGIDKKYFNRIGEAIIASGLPDIVRNPESKNNFKTGFSIGLTNDILDNLSLHTNYLYQFLSVPKLYTKQGKVISYLSNAYDSVVSLGFNHNLVFDSFTGPYVLRTGDTLSLVFTEKGFHYKNVASIGITKYHSSNLKLSFNNKLSLLFGNPTDRAMFSKSMEGFKTIYVDSQNNRLGDILFDTEVGVIVPAFKSSILSLDFGLFVKGGGVYVNKFRLPKESDYNRFNGKFRLSFGGELRFLIANMLPVNFYLAFPVIKADNDVVEYYGYGF